MEFIIEILGEFIIQFVFELGANLCAAFVPDSAYRRFTNAYAKGFLYIMMGLGLAWLSSLLVGELLLPKSFAGLNIAISPLVVGGFMMMLGRWREKKGKHARDLEHFLYGYVFALAFAVMRYSLMLEH